MRVVVQRVLRSEVKVDGQRISNIEAGLLAFVGVSSDDTEQDVQWMVEKLVGLRIFNDEEGKMNKSVTEIDGELLLVSQFTLYGDCRKGKRPSFSDAAHPAYASQLFDHFVAKVREKGLPVKTGQFQADMKVELINDGPVTILLDSKKTF